VEDYTSFSLIGATRDDAAGEAFDKAARVLGIGYPGGKEMDRLATLGDPHAIVLPAAVIRDHPYDFSFSGLKTAVINYTHNRNQQNLPICAEDLAASFTEAVCSAVVSRLDNALKDFPHRTLVLAGGVAANSHIRRAVQTLCDQRHIRLCLPPLSLCGDNGAMIGAQAYYNYLENKTADWDLNASAASSFHCKN
jgi:N6-L-threonylcarbamoyladenine synthase